MAWLEETYGQNKLERLWAWLDQAISQIVLGNYEENSTVTGTVGQVLMGLANLDLPGDIRDLSYDLIHWDTTKEHILQTVLDAAGLLPVIGAVKYGDEASSALKHADEIGEQTAKHGDSILTNAEKDVTSQLTRAQSRNINTLNNIINDHLTESDFSGTLADLQGSPIPNGIGGYFNHVNEMRDSYTGLKSVKNGLEGSLKNPNLNPQVRALLQEKLELTNTYMKRIEELFEPYGGIG